jgi:hypothetical protein
MQNIFPLQHILSFSRNIIAKHKLIFILVLGFLSLTCGFFGFFSLNQSNLNFQLTSFTNNPFTNRTQEIIISNYKLKQGDRPPIFLDYQPPNNPIYTFGFDWNNNKQTKVNIQSNSCIEIVFVNEKEVYLNQETRSAQKNSCSTNDLNLDLSNYLQNGKNEISIVNSNTEYRFLNLNNSFQDSKFVFGYSLILICIIILVIIVSIILKFNWIYTIIFVASTLTRLVYFYSTTPYYREDDAIGHIDYINLLATKTNLLPNTCWQCYHQPFYHSFALGFKNIWLNLGLENIAKWEVAVQGLSILISVVTMIITGLICRLFWSKIKYKGENFFESIIIYLPILMFAFWSGNIQQSTKINNDLFVHLFSVLSLYFILKWYYYKQKESTKWLVLSVFFGCLASLSKTSGLITLVIIATLIIWQKISYREKLVTNINLVKSWILKNTIAFCLIVFLVFTTLFLILYRSSLSSNGIISNSVFIDPKLKLKNKPVDLFYLDLNVYFGSEKSNYQEIDSPLTIGQLLKTSVLVLDHSTNIKHEWVKGLIQYQYFVILLVFLICLLSIYTNGNKDLQPLIIIWILYMLSLFVARITSPYLPTVNIRYILPILLITSIISTFQITRITNRRLKVTLLVLLLIFCFINAIFNWSLLINNSSIF